MPNYEVISSEKSRVPVKMWTKGVTVEDSAKEQLLTLSTMPFIFKWIAAMPDTHTGIGATIGSVIPTQDAIIPAAVGVDIGCGMMALRLSIRRKDFTVSLSNLRRAIESAIPTGRTNNGGKGDRGAWGTAPSIVQRDWEDLAPRFNKMCEKHPKLKDCNSVNHLGTLGTGNHFIEVSYDREEEYIWFMLHSGSRGVGNHGAEYFIRLAKQRCQEWFVNLPDPYLAFFPRSAPEFEDYIEFARWAQDFAWHNRMLMMQRLVSVLQEYVPNFESIFSVHCHHNYVSLENHYGKNVYVTRKGAVSARQGEFGIIPGSMGTKSYIVVGNGNPESFTSCSHGAGRAMGRREAVRRFTVEDHIRATEGIECRKDADVLDETPAAYKDIDAVMAAQTDLVTVKYTLSQLLCVKG